MSNQIIKSIKESVKQWWVPLLVGIILIATGIAAFVSPNESYLALSILFSISFLTIGILETYFAIANRKQMENWGWVLVFGILTIVVGAMLLAHPQISMISLPLYVGFMLMFRSFAAIGWAMDLKDQGVIEWGTFMVMGVLGIIFSFILIWNPALGGMTLVFWTGLALLTGGIFSVYLAFKMRHLHKNWDEISDEVKTQIGELQDRINTELKAVVKAEEQI